MQEEVGGTITGGEWVWSSVKGRDANFLLLIQAMNVRKAAVVGLVRWAYWAVLLGIGKTLQKVWG